MRGWTQKRRRAGGFASARAARDGARALQWLSNRFSEPRFGSTMSDCEGKFEPPILYATGEHRRPGVTGVDLLGRRHRGGLFCRAGPLCPAAGARRVVVDVFPYRHTLRPASGLRGESGKGGKQPGVRQGG